MSRSGHCYLKRNMSKSTLWRFGLIFLIILMFDVCKSLKEAEKIDPEKTEEGTIDKTRKLQSKDSQRLSRKSRGRFNPNIRALEEWVKALDPEQDYNSTMWRKAHRSSTWSVIFNEYAKKLSDIFESVKAKVNFAMIGACDGTSDNTIRELFLPNEHWRGVFVGVGILNLLYSSMYVYT